MSHDAVCGRLFSIEESFVDEEPHIHEHSDKPEGFSTPYTQTQRDTLKQSMAEAIRSLPEREQMVLSLYYDEELNLKEIGQILGVSESRISQIHSQAALRLRARLQDWV